VNEIDENEEDNGAYNNDELNLGLNSQVLKMIYLSFIFCGQK